MASKIKNRVLLDNAAVGNARITAGSAVTPGTGVTLDSQALVMRRARLKLTAFNVTVTAALDYGGTKLCDLPANKILIVGTVVDLSCAITGTGATLAAVDLAVGTVTTASAAFSNAGEKNIVAKIDCTAGGVIDGASASAETNVLIAAGTNAIYVNVASACTADGAATLDGYIDIYYYDLGTPS